MKKILALFALIMIASVSANAQKTNGYIILNSGEKIDVTIKISDGLLLQGTSLYALQWKIKYFDKEDKKHFLKPAQVKELYFKIDTSEYKMISFKNTMKVRDRNYIAKKYVMLYQVQKGQLTNYSYCYGNVGYTMHTMQPYSRGMGGANGISGATLVSTTIPMNTDRVYLNVLQLEGKPPIKVTNRKFKKPLLKYLTGCPEISTKLRNGSYDKSDLKALVNDVNTNCN